MNKQTASRRSITLQSEISETNKLSEFLSECLSERLSECLAEQAKTCTIPQATYDDLRLISEETFTNIVNYAYANNSYTNPDNNSQTIKIDFQQSSKSINITFTDSGFAFNPITDCDIDIEENDCCEGGMGIQIIKSLSDHLQYDRINERNVFTLSKHYT